MLACIILCACMCVCSEKVCARFPACLHYKYLRVKSIYVSVCVCINVSVSQCWFTRGGLACLCVCVYAATLDYNSIELTKELTKLDNLASLSGYARNARQLLSRTNQRTN